MQQVWKDFCKNIHERQRRIKVDYAVDIPGLVKGVVSGDIVDFADFGAPFEGCIITDCYPTTMGTTLYFNQAKG